MQKQVETFDCPPNTQCPAPGTATTDYLGNFYYENGNLRAVYHPHGLIRPTPPSAENITDYVYDYYIKDYLGNVRVVLTEENATYETAMVATMEEYRAEWEEENFENIEEGREPVPYNYPVDASFPLNQYIARIIADNDMTIGPSKVLEVSEGDKVQVATQYFFEENAPGATYEDLGFLIEEILVSMAAAGAGVLPVGEGALVNLINGNTSVGNEVFQFLSTKMDTTDMTRPHGYLVWLAYDKNFNLVPDGSGALRVTDPNELGTLFSGEIPIAKTGYLHVYVSNGTESKTINFDNLYITTMQGKTRQINHYYPYGLRMRMGHGQRYKQMYTTKELQTGEYWDASVSTGLEMYDFEARFYDPQLGRWFVGDPAEQFHNPYLAMGNNPVVYVDPDGEFVFVVVGALLGAYIGGTSANGGEFNPGKWDWNSGDTWAGVLIGGGLGALGGWGAAHAGPALANTSFFSNFGLSGTTAAYTITGGVAGGAIGYSSGFAGGMLHSNGNWEYGHQAGVFGAQIGSAVGSAIGAGYGLATGFDVNMPEYEEPPSLEWNKPLTASTGNGFNSIQDNPSPDDLRKIYSRSYHEFQNMIGNNTIGYSTNSGTEFPTWLYSNASLYPDPMYYGLAPQLEGVNAVISTIDYRMGVGNDWTKVLRIGKDPTWDPEVYPYFSYPGQMKYFDGSYNYQLRIQWFIPDLFSYFNN